MAPATRGYIDSDSYHRGMEQYEKTRKFWSNARFYSLVPLVIGVAALPLPLFFNRQYGHVRVPPNLVVPALILSCVLIAAGTLLTLTTSWVFKHRQLNYPTYQCALHSMKEMGIPHPEKVLAANPQYIESYEDLSFLVIRINNKRSKRKQPYENIDEHAHRVASLVLRDEHSLALTPYLISLIKADPTMSYDALAEKLDNHTPSAQGQPI